MSWENGRQLFQAGDHIVIAGVAVALRGHLPDFLEGIRDYQDGVGVFSQEILQLLVQVLPHLSGMGGKVQVVAAFHAEHPSHAFLEPLLVILQCQVQDGAAMHPVAPEVAAGADPVANLGPLKFLKKVGESEKFSLNSAPVSAILSVYVLDDCPPSAPTDGFRAVVSFVSF